MSYAIVKKIEVREDGVYLFYSDNNIYPHDFHWFNCDTLTKVLKEKGQAGLDLELMKAYENGEFQPGTPNKYSRAVKRLRRMPEFKSFDWRINGGPEYAHACELRTTPDFEALLLTAFYSKDDKKSCIVSKGYNGERVYIKRVNKRNVPFTRDRERAKKFDYPEDAERVLNALTTPREEFTIEMLRA